MTNNVLNVIVGIVAIFSTVTWSLPVFASPAESTDDNVVQMRCWTQQQCEGKDTAKGEANGIWGKSKEYRDRWGKENDDSWSVQNCRATGTPTARCFQEPPNIPLQIGIPGVTTKYCSEFTLGEPPKECSVIGEPCGVAGKCRGGVEGGFPGYIKAFYKFFVAALAVMAVVMVMWGGFKRIMAAGSSEKMKAANETIGGAISGLVLALLSYSLLALINPQLVANAFPPIEAIKPDFWDKCPIASDYRQLYAQGYIDMTKKCVGGNNPNDICKIDRDCPANEGTGQCTASTSNQLIYNDHPGETCGRTLVVNGRECAGQECEGTGQGCFPKKPGDPNSGYACSNYLIQGSLTGIEVNEMALQIICNNTDPAYGSDCAIASPNGSRSSSINVEDQGSYAIDDCMAPDGFGNFGRKQPSIWCGSAGAKGYALLIEVNRDSVFHSGGLVNTDDWYAVDYSSCTSGSTTRRINGTANANQNDPKQGVLGIIDTLHDFRLRWSGVSANKLIPESEVIDSAGNFKHLRCDLDIRRAEFPDR